MTRCGDVIGRRIAIHFFRGGLRAPTLGHGKRRILTRKAILATRTTRGLLTTSVPIVSMHVRNARNMRIHGVARTKNLVRSLTSHVTNHYPLRSIIGPRAKRVVTTGGRRVASSRTTRVRGRCSHLGIHSVLAYRSRRNMYTGYCNEGLTANHRIRVNRSMNVVTTRSVNRPNARLAVHAFRANNITATRSVARNLPHIRRLFRTHGPGNGTVVSGVTNGIAVRSSPRGTGVGVIAIAGRRASSACGVPFKGEVSIGRNSRVRTNAHLVRKGVGPRSVLHILNMRTARGCVIGRIRGICHSRNIRVGSGRVRVVIRRVLHGVGVSSPKSSR